MASDRAMEKAAIAARNAGVSISKLPAMPAKEKPKANAVVAPQLKGDIAGSKAQWVSLINVLRAGGREGAGGLGEIDFGIGTSQGVLSKQARLEKDQMVPYEK